MPSDTDRFRNLVRYFGSAGDAVRSKGEQVRDILGMRHFPSDGSYRERLIKEAFRKIMPSWVSVGDGFLLCPGEGNDPNDNQTSAQVDVLVWDNSLVAPVFEDGDFTIILSGAALAVVEVKATWDYQGKHVQDAVVNTCRAHLLAHSMSHRSQWEPPVTAAVGFNCECFPKDGSGAYDFTDTKHMAKQIGYGYQKWVAEYTGKKIDEIAKDEKFFQSPLIPNPYLLITLDENCKWIAVTQREPCQVENCACPVVSFHEVEAEDAAGKLVDLSLHILLATVKNHISKIADKKKFHGQQDQVFEALSRLDWAAGPHKKIGKSVSLMPKSDFLSQETVGTEILLLDDL